MNNVVIKVLFGIFIAVICILSSCDAIIEPPVTPENIPSYIYFGGREADGTVGIAKIWKVNKEDYSDVTEISFTDGSSYMTVMDMKLINGDIHSLVFNGSSPRKLYYYKNSEPITIYEDDGVDGYSLEVVDDTVYVFGSDYDNFYLWTINTNDEITQYTIGDSAKYLYPGDMLISEGIIYLLGSYSNNDNGLYDTVIWQGSLSDLDNGFTAYMFPDEETNTVGEGLYLDDESLYVCGQYFSTEYLHYLAACWKINLADMSIIETVCLSENTDFYSCLREIVVDGDNIHIIGYENTVNGTAYYQLKYWLNGTVQYLTAGDGFCNVYGLCLDGGKVYIAGYERDVDPSMPPYKNDFARFWVDGVAYNLTDGTENASIRCIAAD
jgi:hypothetical protein